MIIILSPAKTIDFSRKIKTKEYTIPIFQKEAFNIINELKEYPPYKLESIMKINPHLAELNFFRIQNFNDDYLNNSKQAIYIYSGEVYRGLNVNEYNGLDINFAKDSLRILSGLYGILKPLDLIKEHRLEMNTNIQLGKYKNLYEFWGNKLSDAIINELKNHNAKILINLASKEYTDALDLKKFSIITPVFKDYKNGKYKVITIYCKRARGLMASYIIKNKIDNIEDIKYFDLDGYKFQKHMSYDDKLVFTKN